MPQKLTGIRATGLIIIPILSLLLLTSCARDPDAGKLRVTVLDVGQGDCILVESPNGHTMLIDAGGSNDETQVDPREVGLKTVVPYLHYRGIRRIDVVVFTHPHSDHVGGMPDVLREEQVGVVLDGDVLPYPTPSYRACLDVIRQKRISYRRARRGMRIDFRDGVTADVLNPPPAGTQYGTETNNDTMNDYSVVLRMTYGRTHILLDGDAENEAEADMLAHEGDLSADVLKCGHHGAGNATSDAWLTRVHPRYAAISCGLHNHFHHPNPGTLERLKEHGVKTFVTAHDGAIIFVSDGRTVTAQPTIPGNGR